MNDELKPLSCLSTLQEQQGGVTHEITEKKSVESVKRLTGHGRTQALKQKKSYRDNVLYSYKLSTVLMFENM